MTEFSAILLMLAISFFLCCILGYFLERAYRNYTQGPYEVKKWCCRLIYKWTGLKDSSGYWREDDDK